MKPLKTASYLHPHFFFCEARYHQQKNKGERVGTGTRGVLHVAQVVKQFLMVVENVYSRGF